MFDTKSILFITPSAVQGFSVRGEKVTEVVNLPWTTENIGSVLGTARAAVGRTARLLVGEQFSYVATFFLPKGASYASPEEERLAVRDLAGKFIPEDLAESAWDYQDISLPEASLGRPVQVVALVASFARVVVPALREAGFRISVTLPESCAVARLFADREEPLLLVYKSGFFFVAGVMNGMVLSSATSLRELTFETVETVGHFMKERFGFSPLRILFVGACTEGDLGDFETSRAERAGFSIEFSDKNAILGLALKKDVSGNDSDILSIELSIAEKKTHNDSEEAADSEMKTSERFRPHALDERTSSERMTDASRARPGIPNRTKVLAVLFVTLLFVGGVSIVALLRSRREISSNARDIAPVPQATAPFIEDVSLPGVEDQENSSATTAGIPAEDAEEITHKSFRVALENGSGITGAASRLGDDLAEEKFAISGVRTAASASVVSFVRAKEAVPDEFLDELLANAGLEFSLERRRDIPEDADDDVILVLGKDIARSL